MIAGNQLLCYFHLQELNLQGKMAKLGDNKSLFFFFLVQTFLADPPKKARSEKSTANSSDLNHLYFVNKHTKHRK